MEFHLNYKHPVQKASIQHQDDVLLIGSCFAENIGEKLVSHKFNCLVNPNGILFNPISISTALSNYINATPIQENNIVEGNGLFCSLQHHGSFSSVNKSNLIDTINDANASAAQFLKSAKHLIITFGSSNVYRYNSTKQVVANCHKLPANLFTKEQLQPQEIISEYTQLIALLNKFNPNLNIIFTVSPVKYLRDGLVENNLSKAVLIYSIHQLVAANANCSYFPSYELVTDDLRDYRFYKPDMAHPNQQAIDYVWEKFSASYFSDATLQLNTKLQEIVKASQHRPIHSTSEEHLHFKNAYLQKCESLKKDFPFLNFDKELNHFAHS